MWKPLLSLILIIEGFCQLSEAALEIKEVLTEPKNALSKQYKKLFSMNDVKFHITDKALRSIARKATVKSTGARGLRSILESILTDAMFEVEVVVYRPTILSTIDGCSNDACRLLHVATATATASALLMEL